jgi:hypothetical protein
MAEIVLGIGSSHTPMITMGADMWGEHSRAYDHTSEFIDFEGRAAQAPDWLEAELTPEKFADKYDQAQQGLDTLVAALAAAKPDVVLIFGDDQREMFLDDGTPAIALYGGDELADLPWQVENMAPARRASAWAYHDERETVRYKSSGALGTHLAGELTRQGFDVTFLREQPEGRTLGHAFTFVKRRLLDPAGIEPQLVPIFLNTFYEPNSPSAARCFDLGRGVRDALATWEGDERVAVVGSGGLSHFYVEEDLDQQLLEALVSGDADRIKAIPDERLLHGSSEIKNWIAAAGAASGLSVTQHEYVAAYRSMASTGVGLGFAIWSKGPG